MDFNEVVIFFQQQKSHLMNDLRCEWISCWKQTSELVAKIKDNHSFVKIVDKKKTQKDYLNWSK